MTTISQVLNAKNYFERLQLPVQTTAPNVLKKQYKKIALQIHPDKCSDPKATEAFKALTGAYEFLSDSVKQSNHINEIKGQQPRNRASKRRTTEEEFAEQVRKNKPKPKEPKREPQQQPKKKPKTYTSFGFTYKEEPKTSTCPPPTAVSCSFCKRSFPTQSMLDRHMMFSDYNHKHPTFKQQQTPRPTEDPVTKIFDL
jgi:curved DNA-binding protein CbpA